MRVRKQDANGDYLIGAGEADFYIDDPQCVAQRITTRLGLWEGEWFLDLTDGTPWSQEVLGYNTAALRDLIIRERILGTGGVTAIESYQSALNPATRKLTVSGTAQSQYSATTVPFGPVNL